MGRTRQSTVGNQNGPPSDGADLPLLHPRVLGQLTNPGEGRRAHSSEGDCLILSDEELELFDIDRIDEVRHALSTEHAFSEWPGGQAIARRRPRWEKVLWGAVLVAAAVGVGAIIGMVF